MGEYAIRESDNEEIKIGTCESMYYLRLDDKNKVSPLSGSEFGCRWRIPFPDEDDILPGEYDIYNRGERLFNFKDPESIENPGNIQLYHNDAGLFINVPCYHGEKLPDNMNAHWNGKSSWFYELSSLRTDNGKVFPVVRCRFCDHAWRYEWSDVLPYVSEPLKTRLSKYQVS